MKALARVQLGYIDPAASYGIEEAVSRFRIPHTRMLAAIRGGRLKAGTGDYGHRVVAGAELIAWVEMERAQGTKGD